MLGVTATALTCGLAGCGSTSAERPPKPTNEYCKDWDWAKDEGVWVCDETTSTHYGRYYYGGAFYKSKSTLLQDTSYKAYTESKSFSGKKSSGFGSGSSVFGG